MGHREGCAVNKVDYQRAIEAGANARRAGRKRESCPLYAMGRDGELFREAWYQGWDDEDARRRK